MQSPEPDMDQSVISAQPIGLRDKYFLYRIDFSCICGNELSGYEPEGREFESLRARQLNE
jgi:hypothetical protein